MTRAHFLAFSLCIAAPLAAQNPPNPWARVPVFPTQCYSEKDSFAADLQAALDALGADLERQSTVNQGLKDQLARLDPATKRARMTAYLSSNPTKAQAAMAAMASQGAAAQATVQGDQRPALEAEFKQIEVDRAADDARVLQPKSDEWFRLNRSGSSATQAQADAAGGAYNTAYELQCNKWIIGGAFPDFLRRYREYVVNEWLPPAERGTSSQKAVYEMFGIDASAYQSTTSMQEVRKYLNFVGSVFGKRRGAPMSKP